MFNLPEVKIGIVAVSRDCFPIELSGNRRDAVHESLHVRGVEVYCTKRIIENECHVEEALDELKQADCNTLVVYLGNFGPEGPETMLAQKFPGPVMFFAAAEETLEGLSTGRGDAYCGLLNASYNLKLRGVNAYIPEHPVGTPENAAVEIIKFIPIARIIIGVKSLKIVSFGPRPQDFFACNAPIAPLFKLGVEIMENSELDLFESFNAHEGDSRIAELATQMEQQLGDGNNHPDILPKLAQYEITLMDYYEKLKGASKFVVFANKCWPAFQTQFGFVPCYVNSRLASKGIPVACETDIYGALSEYILAAATLSPPTLLDINNTVPFDMYLENKDKLIPYHVDYKPSDLFMGFHCGNTAKECMKKCSMQYQLIMHSLLEPNLPPNITRGTLEGQLAPGDTTIFRLQASADCKLRSYIAHGEIRDIDPLTFGSAGVFAITEMERFYRHVLVGKNYPHHAAVAFSHVGFTLYEAVKLLGVTEIDYNQPATLPYPGENPFNLN